MPNLHSLLIFGGEPLLHPEIDKICEIFRRYLPKTTIAISTNGVILDKIDIKKIQYLQEVLKIKEHTPIYLPFLEKKEKIESLFEKHNVELRYLESRPFFFYTTIDLEGKQDPNNYFHCGKSEFPFEFHMYKNKIYSCAVASCMTTLDIPDEKNDYIDIYDLKDEQQLEDLYYTQLQSCKYCVLLTKQNIFPWNVSSRKKEEYFYSLKDLYLDNYQEYNRIVNNDAHLIQYYQNDFFKQYVLPGINEYVYSYYNIKFFNGIADIYIPFNNEYNNINFHHFKEDVEKNIEEYKNCNFYFVSINASREKKSEIYDLFMPFSKNIKSWFFEADSYESGLELIKNNSYTNNIIILNK